LSFKFVDLHKQYLTIKDEIDNAISSVISETAFIGGDYVRKFEQEYASAYGIKHCIGCGNGTDAIYIALKALGIGPGDEVITVANTWISTSETISQTGATPVFVDIDQDYYTIDVTQIEDKITPRTKAIIPVHLFGHPCDMDALTGICERNSLFLIEDCAQAHFAEWNGQRVGTFGDVGTFSFFPGKNLGAYGDAGGIITNNDDLARKMRMFANHGALKKHHHEIEGINSRLDGLQAAILSAKLPHILEWTQKRIENAKFYDEALNRIDIATPAIHNKAKHVFHLYVVRLKNRNDIQIALQELEIQTGIHYPTPLPFLKAYKYLNYKPNDFPNAYEYMSNILSLPMYPELKREQIQFVSKAIIQALG
jgi:dTDP-4-amino-4,6-dideoxygalactose transaminase